jgi:phosphoribosylformylglycinamidine synthase
MLKPEIHDPQGEAIKNACHRLGFGQVAGVRQGKRFEVELSGPADEAAVAMIAELAGELLANPVIEEFVLRTN